MAQTFLERIQALSDAELLQYLRQFQDYRTEAVEAALEEVDRRGLALPPETREGIQAGLAARSVAAQAQLNRGFVAGLGRTLEARLRRIHQLAAAMLALGLGWAAVIYLLAVPVSPNPLGFEPEDSKKYLRDMEAFGGKVNVLAAQISAAWNGLWHGRNLAFTVAGLTLLLTLTFWFIGSHRARDLEAFRDGTER